MLFLLGPTYKIDEVMDQNIYLEILQNTMLPYVEEVMALKCQENIHKNMQDNDLKHTSRRVKVGSWRIGLLL